MDFNKDRGKESVGGASLPGAPETPSGKAQDLGGREREEVREGAKKILRHEGAPNTFETAEIVESVETGEVSETTGEDRKKVKGGFPIRTQREIDELRQKLLASLPPQEVMVKQLKQKLRIQEKDALRKEKRLRKIGHKAAFELNKVWASLRQIRAYFYTVAHATYEVIKNLWLKIVHGV